MYGHANDNGRATRRMYHAQFPDRRIPDYRIFQRLHRQLRETGSFHVTRQDANRRRAVRNPILEKKHLKRYGSSTSFESGRLLSPPELLPVSGTAMCAAAGLHKLFTDEATFTREGVFNAHHSLVCATKSQSHAYQQRFRVNAWAGIVNDLLIGQFLLPPRLNDECSYFSGIGVTRTAAGRSDRHS
ncbi:uncharacterized protein TNCV_452241 [Trichonephila clavipes]|nr:uncharacterized protein TNCV_452241 [Trichonephila clavipes]